jgi:hypothetical protein
MNRFVSAANTDGAHYPGSIGKRPNTPHFQGALSMRGIHSGLIFFFTVFLGLQPILPQTVAAESAPPGFFQQLEPADAAIDVPITPTLSWNVANRATDYGYCIDTTDDDACTGGDSGYIRVQDTSATPHLLPQTTYYWNIRAYNAFGFTTSGTWQQFTTTTTTKDISSPITAGSVSMPLQDAHTGTMAGMADDSALPGVLNKIAPTNGGVDQPTTVLLSWSEASEATSYGYCFDTTADNACDEGDERGFRRIAGTSVRISGLELGTTYFWQVRAYNATGHIQADGGQWASFTTAPVSILPEDFTKLSPATGITNVGTTVDLTWSASPDAAGYGYCINQNPSYACEGGDQGYIATPHTTVTVSDLKPGVIYYWQVRAYNAAGDYIPADGVGQWANFTTAPRVLDRPIAFLSTRDGNFEIYTMTPDGAESVRLTNDPATESFAAWSPDGRQLAFTSDRSGNNDIYVMNADGSAVTQVTSDPAHDSYPSWSPDGSRLVFQSDRTGSTDIYAINTDGSSPTRLRGRLEILGI